MNNKPSTGLSQAEAEKRLQQYGPNALPEQKVRLWLVLLGKFWAPVPWMLEVTILLELYLGKNVEALVIGFLLVFNAILSFIQENRAQNALTLLRQKLVVNARTLRDGNWQLIPARELVPDDVIHLRMGDLIPADIRITEGSIEVDQSTLTGESAWVGVNAGDGTFSGAIVRQGEATGIVFATGTKTRFGKTAELVGEAKTVSHLGEIIFSIVKYLVIADAILVGMVIAFAITIRLGWQTILPFALIILIASVPVALPATFTLAIALGAAELARQGVLVARLSAIEEAAAMTVLASDKTGTITLNQLTLNSVVPFSPYTEEDVLRWGAIASDDASQDPIDLAILNRIHETKISTVGKRIQFIPFDPKTKRTETFFRMENGKEFRILKGAPQTLKAMSEKIHIGAQVSSLAAKGARVIAVAIGQKDKPMQMVGLLGLQDSPRADSRALIHHLGELGVRVVMVTGDDPLTAKAIGTQVGIEGEPCTAAAIGGNSSGQTTSCSIFANVFPEDKYRLVKEFQKSGHIVGMTGDGVNDAPALKQAEVGIAVSSATDVAKAAASLVLTLPGLQSIVSAIKTSRQIYQRMLTYTLNKIIKTFQISLFLSLGFIFGRIFVVTPLLIILLLFANDFVTMSISTDHVSYSPKPDRWNIRALMLASFLLSMPVLLLSFGFYFVGMNFLHLPLPQFQTLMFVMLVFTGQINVYLVRERRHFWMSKPSLWMIVGTLGDVLIVTLLATQGILMTSISLSYVALSLLAVLLFLPLADWIKISIFRLAHLV